MNHSPALAPGARPASARRHLRESDDRDKTLYGARRSLANKRYKPATAAHLPPPLETLLALITALLPFFLIKTSPYAPFPTPIRARHRRKNSSFVFFFLFPLFSVLFLFVFAFAFASFPHACSIPLLFAIAAIPLFRYRRLLCRHRPLHAFRTRHPTNAEFD